MAFTYSIQEKTLNQVCTRNKCYFGFQQSRDIYQNKDNSLSKKENQTTWNWSFVEVCSSKLQVTPSGGTCTKRKTYLAWLAEQKIDIKVHGKFIVTNNNKKMLDGYMLSGYVKRLANAVRS